MTTKDISVIILAAGLGRRFGQPKWQAQTNGITFLEQICNTLEKAHFQQIICVARPNSIPFLNYIEIAINDYPENGPLSSIATGVQAMTPCDGILIMPVDHPFVSETTLQCLKNSFEKQPLKIIRPRYQHKAGHPIIIPYQFALKLPSEDMQGGLGQYIKQSNVALLDIDVEDDGILTNINSIEELTKKNPTTRAKS